MNQPTITLNVPLDSLLESISALSPKEKLQIFEALHKELEQAEEELYESDPAIQAQIREARAAYQARDYVTLDDYAARSSKK
jgi:ElaB/YqjD/DUF883 family membrane-anchored ribosome-binding protein